MKNALSFIIFVTILFFFQTSSAQVVISDIGGETADPSSILDLQTSTKGFLPPRLTQSEIEELASPADGLMVYNTNDKHLYIFDGGTNYWKKINFDSEIIFPGCGTLTDIDGNTYNTIMIGTQCWMKENLATTKYNDGTGIPTETNNDLWDALTTPAYCWYNNDQATYGDTYGALYNNYAVGTGNLCPTGWHAPTDAEWTNLTDYLGGEGVAGGKLKETGTIHWNSPNTGATNEVGFTALPAGSRLNGFAGINQYGYWWSSTFWTRDVGYHHDDVNRNAGNQSIGFSVRCIKD